jgi:phosphate transport system protein
MTSEIEFENVRVKLLEIGKLGKDALNLSIKGLMERDAGLSEKIQEMETHSDLMNVEVEDRCLTLLSTQILSGSSFRFVSMAIKISERFERIADLALEITNLSKRGLPKQLLAPSKDLPKMSIIASEMIDLNLDALSRKRGAHSERLRELDEKMIRLAEQICGNLVANVHQNPHSFDDAILLLSIMTILERIGEIACKIGNRIIYATEGKRIWIA